MNIEQQLIIYRLAHENDMTVSKFLDKLQEIFHVDTSDYPKTEDGSVVYPNGNVGIELEFPSIAEEMRVYEAAELAGVTTNQFIADAVRAAMQAEKEKNPELFQDLDSDI